jgi:hypothetical protein
MAYGFIMHVSQALVPNLCGCVAFRLEEGSSRLCHKYLFRRIDFVVFECVHTVVILDKAYLVPTMCNNSLVRVPSKSSPHDDSERHYITSESGDVGDVFQGNWHSLTAMDWGC